jgi:Na+-translocating ferredoxin:NAD+ oxidoreductase RnfG subunit
VISLILTAAIVLGYWNAETNKVSLVNSFVGDLVTDTDFCTWRSVTKKGGDFEVFSDVHILPLAVPEVIEV